MGFIEQTETERGEAMNYILRLTDAEREYLTGAIERAVIDDAKSTEALASRSILWPKKNAEAFAKARAALHAGAGLLGKLSPDSIEVADPVDAPAVTDSGIYSPADAEALAVAVPGFDPRALRPNCAHGIPFDRPCDLCEGDNGGDVRTMPIQT